jgi:hypothetical protein
MVNCQEKRWITVNLRLLKRLNWIMKWQTGKSQSYKNKKVILAITATKKNKICLLKLSSN